MATFGKITVTRLGKGKIRVSSANKNIADAYVDSNEEVIVEKTGAGTTQIYISVEEDDNYQAVPPQLVKVVCDSTIHKVERPKLLSQNYTNRGKTLSTTKSFIHDGTVRSLKIDNGDSEFFTREGDVANINAGKYSVTYKLKSGCVWANDNSTSDYVIDWEITKGSEELSLSTTTVNLDNENPVQKIEVSRWGDGKLYVKSSNENVIKATVKGTIITLTRISGGNATITVGAEEGKNYFAPDEVKISTSAAAVTKEMPSKYDFNNLKTLFKQKGKLTYNTKSQNVTIDNYDPSYHKLGGVTSAVNANTYTAEISPADGYHWYGTNGDTSKVSVEWKIEKADASLTLPNASLDLTVENTSTTVTITYVGDGEVQWSSDDTSKKMVEVARSGNVLTFKRKAEGNVVVSVWADSGDNYKSVGVQTISVKCGPEIYYVENLPTAATTSFDYQVGDTRTLAVANGTHDGFTQTGNISLKGLKPGEYQAIYQLKENYEWKNNPTTDIKITVPTLSIANFITGAPANTSLPINDLDTEFVAVNGNKIIPSTAGNYSITLSLKKNNSVWLDNSKNSSRTLTYKVSGDFKNISALDYRVNKFSDSVIDLPDLLRTGKAADCVKVGDLFPITLNGTIGEGSNAITFNSFEMYATVIGIDHNIKIESEGKHSIHFALGTSLDGVDIAFYQLPMNNVTNSDGWAESWLCNTVLPQLFSIFPSDYLNAIPACTKYTNGTQTYGELFLLSKAEIFGDAADNQVQYDYFKTNSAIRYSHVNEKTDVVWWLRDSAGTDLSYVVNGRQAKAIQYRSEPNVKASLVVGFMITE